MDSRIASTSSGSSDAAAPTSRHGGSHAASKSRSSALDVGAANKSNQPPIKCPRCDSLNTKFCYYNNYSQTQPRHYCKSCKRYWTEGGSLRNVPVGGGCRKNKRVKPRPLNINLGAAGLLNPTSLLDDTTSNMLARLSSTSPFPNFCAGASSFGSEDTSTHLMHIAFSRFQESMRLRQQQQSSDQSPETAPYFDMSFPALVHKQSAPTSCSCGACGSCVSSLHHGLCGGVMNTFDGNLGFSNPEKLEHDVAMAGFCNGAYELNPMYHDQNANMHMVGTSATATLASIEDQLSSFSNLQHVDAFNTDASTGLVEQQKCGLSMDDMKRDMMSAGPFGRFLGLQVDSAGESMVDSAFSSDETKERLLDDMDEKPLLSTTNNHDISLVMRTDGSSWQQPSLMMNDMLLQGDIWNAHGARWQENMQQAMAATPAAAAGGVL